MRLYIEAEGYEKLFSTYDIIMAIYSAWNYNGDLWLLPNGTSKSDIKRFNNIRGAELIFSSSDPMASDLSKFNLEVCESEGAIEMHINNTVTGKTYFFNDVEHMKLDLVK